MQKINLIQIWWGKNSLNQSKCYNYFKKYKSKFEVETNINYLFFDNDRIIKFLKNYNIYKKVFCNKIFQTDNYRLQSDILRIVILSFIGGFYLDLDVEIYDFDKFIEYLIILNNKYRNIIPISKHIFFLKIDKLTSFSIYIRNYYIMRKVETDTNMITYNWIIKFTKELTFVPDNEIYKYVKHHAVTK